MLQNRLAPPGSAGLASPDSVSGFGGAASRRAGIKKVRWRKVERKKKKGNRKRKGERAVEGCPLTLMRNEARGCTDALSDHK